MSEKPVQHGYFERSSKVLVSLEDLTSLRGEELLQNIYLVVIGYNLDMERASNWVLDTGDIKKVVDNSIAGLENDKTNQLSGDKFKKELESKCKIENEVTVEGVQGKITEEIEKYLGVSMENVSSDESGKNDGSSDVLDNDASSVDVPASVASITDSASNNAGSDSGHSMSKKEIRDEVVHIAVEYAKKAISDRVGKTAKNAVPSGNTALEITTGVQQNEFGTGLYKSVYTNKVDDFFFAWHSPVFTVQKGRVHQFMDGYPLFYGIPNRQASVFVAALDIGTKKPVDTTLNMDIHEEEMKQAIKSFQEVHCEFSKFYNTERKKLVDLAKRERKISDNFDTIKTAFSLLIKTFETQAVKLGHQIRYTNVFTFKENDEWLEGGHQDWGDHRMAMTIKVEVSN